MKNILIKSINDLKKSETWKIQLTLTTNFISSKEDKNEEREMHVKSDNTEVMMNDEGEVIEAFIQS